MTRRGYVAGALVAFVLVLAALAVVPRVLAGDDEAVEPFSADDYYRIDGSLTCDTDVREVPVLPLDAEPVAMLVCADPDSSVPWTAPAELVEGDLPGLVDVLAGLEPVPDEDVACTMQGGPAYDLVLRFSRGRVARIHGDSGGCGFVTAAAGRWFGAPQLLDTALAIVERRREGRTPPVAASTTADLSCDHVFRERGPALSLTGDESDIVRMVSCWEPNAPDPGPWSETDVPPREVGILTRDVARSASTALDARDLRCVGGVRHHYFQSLVGQTAWGDVLVVLGECRRFIVGMPPREPSLVWHPSPRSQRILDSLRR